MIRLCSRSFSSLIAPRTATALFQPVADKRAVAFSVVQKRFYCGDAKLHERVTYNRHGFKGLSEEEQKDALKVLHNFVMKRMTQQDYKDSLNAMETMAELTEFSSHYSAISGAHLRNYDFYKKHPSELQKLYDIFAASGIKLFRSTTPQNALPILKQALMLKVPPDECNFETIYIRNAIELAQLCQDDRNYYAHALIFRRLREQAEKINLPKDQIASLLRNEAACLVLNLCFKPQKSMIDDLMVHTGKQLYKRASLSDPQVHDVEAIRILESFGSRTGLGFSTKVYFVWKEGSFPYIDIPRMLSVF
ncbi:MAG TPA: hypothetical protein VLG76_04800 [Rhabdochlamydiaceae bacterium]|nr:hypothetical protein [Rhabdochlamydiaceae bacterium]